MFRLKKCANGARSNEIGQKYERQPHNFKGVNTGSGTPPYIPSSSGRTRGFQHIQRHFPAGAIKKTRRARGFADTSVRVLREKNLHPWYKCRKQLRSHAAARAAKTPPKCSIGERRTRENHDCYACGRALRLR